MDLHACRDMLELITQDDDPIRVGIDAGLRTSKLRVSTALDLHHGLAEIRVRGRRCCAGLARASVPTSPTGGSFARSCDGGLKRCAAVRRLPASPGRCEDI